MEPNQGQPTENQPQPEIPVQPGSWNQPTPVGFEPTSFAAEPVQFTDPAATVNAQQLDSAQAPVAPIAVQPQPVDAPSSASKGFSIAALVVGIIAFLTGVIGIGILLGVVAIILGVISLVKHRGGKGMAIAGIILGALAFVVGGIIFAIVLVAFNGIQERAVAAANYQSAYDIGKVAQQYSAGHISADDSFAYHYPTYDQLVAEPSLKEELKSKLHSGNSKSVTKEKPIAYESCSEGGTFYYFAGIDGAKSFPIGSPEKC